MKISLLSVLLMLLAGCTTVVVHENETQTAEEVLGTLLLASAIGESSDSQEFIEAIYPFHSQILTFAFIGFHMDKDAWPSRNDELIDFIHGSPSNPNVQDSTLSRLEFERHEDGSLSYSNAEDRKRGRMYTISKDHRVTITIPSNLFAGDSTPDISSKAPSTISFDWSEVIFEAMTKALKN